MNDVKVFRLSPDAVLPVRAESGSIGYDLCCLQGGMIEPGERKAFRTGLVISFEGDCYARIAPRSGLALRNGIDVLGGVIDKSYRGEIIVILINHGTSSNICVNKGDRIAQLIFEKAYTPEISVVEDIKDLGTTQRGNGGFGSSGV